MSNLKPAFKKLHSSDQPQDLKLSCFVVGEKEPVLVEVRSDQYVGDLKKAIKASAGSLKDITASRISLWKINESPEAAAKLTEEDMTEDKAKAICEISHYWKSETSLTKGFVHVFATRSLAILPGPKEKTNITSQLRSRWLNGHSSGVVLPRVSELGSRLDQLLPEDSKIPISQRRFDYISESASVEYPCTAEDVGLIFRVSETENLSMFFSDRFISALTNSPPYDWTASSFHSFWDSQLRNIIEVIFPHGKSIREFNEDTNIRLRPDYGFLLEGICPFRGEEAPPDSWDDPKSGLVSELIWRYSPAPYIFGYYAIGTEVTLCAITEPSSTHGTPIVQDLHSADLRHDLSQRLRHLLRLINLARYLEVVSKMVKVNGHEFQTINTEDKRIFIGLHVEKQYIGPDRHSRIAMLNRTYAILHDKKVPNIDTILSLNLKNSSVILTPRGIASMPGTERDLLNAIVCVLETLKVLHADPTPILHRDIRWPNVIQLANDHNRWMLTDWEDASLSADSCACLQMSEINHCLTVFEDGHGTEVDLWGVGFLVLDFNKTVSPELREIAEWMQDLTSSPSASEALERVQDYFKRIWVSERSQYD